MDAKQDREPSRDARFANISSGKNERSQKDSQNGSIRVTKSKVECQNEKEVYEILKKKWPMFYGEAQVNNTTVSTKEGKIFTLTSIPKVVDALRALKEQLHDNDILHGDLKPKHIRQTAQFRPYFIDFGFSIVIPKGGNKTLQPVKGFTAQWASLDSIVRHTAHELDDYEAIFMIALFDTVALLDKEDPNTIQLPPLPNPELKSLKTWAAWKLQLMEQVFAFYCTAHAQPKSTTQQAAKQTLSWVVEKLILVWTMPRSAARLTEAELTVLHDAKGFDLGPHVKITRNLFLEHLGRYTKKELSEVPSGIRVRTKDALNSARPEPKVDRNEPDLRQKKQDTALLEACHGEMLQEKEVLTKALARNKQKCKFTPICSYPNAVLWKNCVARRDDKSASDPVPTSEEGKKGSNWAEYDTLLVFTNDFFQTKDGRLWEYGEEKEWDFLGKGGEFGVKLIKAIGGKYLYLETTSDKKHIAAFLAKFERFVLEYSLRPLDVLLLVIGIVIECHQQPFFPQHFRTMVNCVQHSDWKCAGCSTFLHTSKDLVFYYCKCGGVFCSSCSEKHVFSQKGGTHECKKVKKDLLPNLSLFVLLLAGRVCVTNKIAADAVGASSAISTEQRNDALAKLEAEIAARKTIEKRLEESERQLAESRAQSERQLAEARAENERQLAEARAETARALERARIAEQRQQRRR